MTSITTDGNAPDTGGNEMSDGEVLRYLASQVESLIELTEKRLDHLDQIAHEIDQKVAGIHGDLEKYRPLLERFADPGAAVRGFLGGKRKPAGGGT